MDMKELIRDRLQGMEDLEHRQLLKTLMTNVFLQLEEHNTQFHSQLEKRIFEELDSGAEQYDIYCSICRREVLDPFHPFLFPMVAEDLTQEQWDMNELMDSITGTEVFKLMTIFMACDFLEIEKMLDSKRHFIGKIITDRNEYEIELFVQRNQSYVNEIEKLYHIFLKNDLQWNTVHHPYLAKFLDVYIKPLNDIQIEDGEKIEEVIFQLDEFDAFKHTDIIPLWNVRQVEVRDIVFPAPVHHRINYEHRIQLDKLGSEHGYLADGDPKLIRYVKRTEDALIVASEEGEGVLWDVYQIANPVEDPINLSEYHIASNRRKSTFLEQYIHKNGTLIRSVAEISRVVRSFELEVEYHVDQVEIMAHGSIAIETYPLNRFLHDNVRDEQDRRLMVIVFSTQGERNFTTYDTLSYIVAEIQLVFPEYQCAGVLR